VDCSKIARVLPAFQPQWTVRRGAEELRDAYERQQLTSEDFNGSRYLRIKRVNELQAAGKLDENLRWQIPVA
jgi:hypothetical protein